MNYEERKQPNVYKPLIDEALIRIVEATGGDVDEARQALDEVEHDGTSFEYLNDHAVPAVSSFVDLEVVQERIPHRWGKSLLEGKFEAGTMLFPNIEFYPEDSKEFLHQQNFIGGYDADVVGLWDRDDRQSICHAHMEGFWILGEDAIDFVEKTADELEADG